MSKTGKAAAALLAALVMAGCTATADERMGEAQGYGGTLRVAVVMDGDKIAEVRVAEHAETQGIGTKAIESLPQAIVQANSADVEAVTGATVTSNAIMAAVRDALATDDASVSPGGTASAGASPSPEATDSAQDGLSVAKIGMGMSSVGRIGPGKDDADGQVYSFNVVFAHGMFDENGRILALDVDQLEVATPNYDGASMPEFSGFPGQGGYAKWDDAAGKTNGKTEDTEENFLSEIEGWKTKRARGDEYRLTSGTWAEEMDAFEKQFTGMTVDEVEAWVKKYCSDANGRPLTDKSDKEGDQEKYNALTESEKTMLADVTSTATMSLNDSHGNIVAAIRNAWENAQ